jgi:hypothetical protein
MGCGRGIHGIFPEFSMKFPSAGHPRSAVANRRSYDEINIYDQVLSQSGIQALIVPEPSALAVCDFQIQ